MPAIDVSLEERELASMRELAQISTADEFRLLDLDERRDRLSRLSPDDQQRLVYSWTFWARPEQLLPEGDWTCWLVMAGRGFGKTRTGAETVRFWARTNRLVNIIGPTADDARDVMIEGPSGIMRICPDDERPQYLPSRRKLIWPNGCESLVFTADEPDRIRGKQHNKLWCDELASWRYAEAWDQAMFGLRLGERPQAVVTTTPRPTRLVKTLRDARTTHCTRGTSYENKHNLSEVFYAQIITRYEGTRLGRQELQAEVLEDNPGALWHRENIDFNRVVLRYSSSGLELVFPGGRAVRISNAAPQEIAKALDLVRIVVAVDPPATSTDESDECGIVVCGMDRQTPPHFYTLEDKSQIASPDTWSGIAVAVYHRWRADRLIGEKNNGGEMVEAVIRHKDANVSYKGVNASRGKTVRAEPIAALAEQNRDHHVGEHGKLEDQLVDWDPAVTTDSPDRLDAKVWAMTELAGEYSGEHGLVEYYASGMAQRDLAAMEVPVKRTIQKVEGARTLAKPVIPAQAPACPMCGGQVTKRVANSDMCAACGHQYNVDEPQLPRMNRNTILAKAGGLR